jgi:hypothetical protein
MLSGALLDEVFPVSNSAAVATYRSKNPPRVRRKVAADSAPPKKSTTANPSPLCDLFNFGYSPSMFEAMETYEPLHQPAGGRFPAKTSGSGGSQSAPVPLPANVPDAPIQPPPQPQSSPYQPEQSMYMSYPYNAAIDFFSDQEEEEEGAEDPSPHASQSSVYSEPEPVVVAARPASSSVDEMMSKYYEIGMYFVFGVVLILLLERFIQMGSRLASASLSFY